MIDMNTKIGELEFTEEVLAHTEENNRTGPDTRWFCDTPVGRFTVVDRETGFTYDGYRPMRDIETGYRDNDNGFLLRSGRFDIRRFPELTIEQAIARIRNGTDSEDNDQ
jgi:hypothetical protein